MTVAQGTQTRIVRTDWLGRITFLQEPENGGNHVTTFSYSYNSTGLLVTRKRPRANQTNGATLTTTTTQYDALGRILGVTYDDGTPDKVYSYDDPNHLNASGTHRANVAGRLSTAMTFVHGTQSMITGFEYSYDVVGRPSEVFQCGAAVTCGNGALTRAVSTGYDLAGRQVTESDPVAGLINYGLSLAGEITSINDATYSNTTNPGPVLSNVQMGPYGVVNYRLGNSLTGVNTYDTSGRTAYGWLCSGGVTTTYCSGGTQLYGWATAWSGGHLANSIDTVINSGGSYGYDALGNMTSYNGTLGSPVSYAWSYDRYGNRYAASSPGANLAISPSTNMITVSGITYDAVGNETSDGVHSYAYDGENNLISIDGGSTAAFTFNALNERVAITDAKGAREYTFDAAGRRVATWLPGTNTGIQGQIWWGNIPVAYRDTNGSMYFQTADWEGTQRVLTDYTGAIASLYRSMPWGENYSTSGIDTNLAHYAGLDQAENNSIEHAQYRDYDATAGRWLSPDPYFGSYDWSNPQTFNRYTYAGNRPNSNVDPSGLENTACPNFEFVCDPGEGGGDPCAGADACVTAPAPQEPNPYPGPDLPGGPNPDPGPGLPNAPTSPPSPGGTGGRATGSGGNSNAPSNPTQTPQPCSRLSAFSLSYSQDVQNHIMQRHGNSGLPGVSQYFGNFSQIKNINFLTALFGTQTSQGNRVRFEFTIPQLPWLQDLGIQTHFGTDASGQHTNTNRLVTGSNCTSVVTSYPIGG